MVHGEPVEGNRPVLKEPDGGEEHVKGTPNLGDSPVCEDTTFEIRTVGRSNFNPPEFLYFVFTIN
eukprot:752329-Hanusia_phi.AAC.1